MSKNSIVIVDCAWDLELSHDLEKYLSNKGYNVQQSKTKVKIKNPRKGVEDDISLFLSNTNREKHTLLQVEPGYFLLSIERPIEDLGLKKCEICEFVTPYEEELLTHRRTHGI